MPSLTRLSAGSSDDAVPAAKIPQQQPVSSLCAQIHRLLVSQEKIFADLDAKLSLLSATKGTALGHTAVAARMGIEALPSESLLLHSGNPSRSTSAKATAAVVVALPSINISAGPSKPSDWTGPAVTAVQPHHHHDRQQQADDADEQGSGAGSLKSEAIVIRPAVHKIRAVTAATAKTSKHPSSPMSRGGGGSARKSGQFSARATAAGRLRNRSAQLVAAVTQDVIRRNSSVRAGPAGASAVPSASPQMRKQQHQLRANEEPTLNVKKCEPPAQNRTTVSGARGSVSSAGSPSGTSAASSSAGARQQRRAPAAGLRPPVHGQPHRTTSTSGGAAWDLSQRLRELEDIQASNSQALERTHSTFSRTLSLRSRAEQSPQRHATTAPSVFASIQDMTSAEDVEDAPPPPPAAPSRRASAVAAKRITAFRMSAKSPRVHGFAQRLGHAYLERRAAEVHVDPNATNDASAASATPATRTQQGPQQLQRAARSAKAAPCGATEFNATAKAAGTASRSRPPWSATTKVQKVKEPEPLSRGAATTAETRVLQQQARRKKLLAK